MDLRPESTQPSHSFCFTNQNELRDAEQDGSMIRMRPLTAYVCRLPLHPQWLRVKRRSDPVIGKLRGRVLTSVVQIAGANGTPRVTCCT